MHSAFFHSHDGSRHDGGRQIRLCGRGLIVCGMQGHPGMQPPRALLRPVPDHDDGQGMPWRGRLGFHLLVCRNSGSRCRPYRGLRRKAGDKSQNCHDRRQAARETSGAGSDAAEQRRARRPPAKRLQGRSRKEKRGCGRHHDKASLRSSLTAERPAVNPQSCRDESDRR